MHPGELLPEEILPALGRRRGEIAHLLGISRQALLAVPTERASVTPEMALRLGRLCRNGPELWLALQTRYDLERLSREKAAEIDAIPTLQAARSNGTGSWRACVRATSRPPQGGRHRRAEK